MSVLIWSKSERIGFQLLTVCTVSECKCGGVGMDKWKDFHELFYISLKKVLRL